MSLQDKFFLITTFAFIFVLVIANFFAINQETNSTTLNIFRNLFSDLKSAINTKSLGAICLLTAIFWAVMASIVVIVSIRVIFLFVTSDAVIVFLTIFIAITFAIIFIVRFKVENIDENNNPDELKSLISFLNVLIILIFGFVLGMKPIVYKILIDNQHIFQFFVDLILYWFLSSLTFIRYIVGNKLSNE